jgi:hypothetical protein
MAALSRKVWRGIFLFFAQKMQGLKNQRKFLSVKAKYGPGRALKNVLTAKNGRFWGPFGRKTGGPLQKKDTFFRVFSIFGDFVPRKRLKLRMFHRFDPSKKNRAQKPTVGFWVNGVSI